MLDLDSVTWAYVLNSLAKTINIAWRALSRAIMEPQTTRREYETDCHLSVLLNDVFSSLALMA